MARIPVILTPGNHENYDNTMMINNRFAMAGTRSPLDNNLVAFQTHHLQILGMNFDYLMMNSALKDTFFVLFSKTVAKFNKRNDKHFNLFFAHRPFHCKANYEECEKLNGDFGVFESKLNETKIHLNLWGHVHHYERLDSIFKHQVSTASNMYSLIVGTGGNKEDEIERSGEIEEERGCIYIYIYRNRGYEERGEEYRVD